MLPDNVTLQRDIATTGVHRDGQGTHVNKVIFIFLLSKFVLSYKKKVKKGEKNIIS